MSAAEAEEVEDLARQLMTQSEETTYREPGHDCKACALTREAEVESLDELVRDRARAAGGRKGGEEGRKGGLRQS